MTHIVGGDTHIVGDDIHRWGVIHNAEGDRHRTASYTFEYGDTFRQEGRSLRIWPAAQPAGGPPSRLPAAARAGHLDTASPLRLAALVTEEPPAKLLLELVIAEHHQVKRALRGAVQLQECQRKKETHYWPRWMHLTPCENDFDKCPP